MVQTHIHQIERPLHVGQVRPGHRKVILAQAVKAAQFADRLWRDKAGTEQTVAVEHGVPLAVGDIAFAPGQIARVRPVEKRGCEALGLEQVVHRDPIDAGRFQGDGVDFVLLEPGAECAQLGW